MNHNLRIAKLTFPSRPGVHKSPGRTVRNGARPGHALLGWESLELRTLLAIDLSPLKSELPILLQQLQGGLTNNVLDATIPFLGKQLPTLSAGTVASSILNLIKTDVGNINAATAAATLATELSNDLTGEISGPVTAIGNNVDSITFDIPVQETITSTATFDLGLPGIGLKITSPVKVNVSTITTFHLDFGFDASGFYFDTDPFNKDASLEVTAKLASTNPPLTGTLGFLQVMLADQGSMLDGTYHPSIALASPLRAGDLANLSTAAGVQAGTITGMGELKLGVTAAFTGSSVFPTLKTDLDVTDPLDPSGSPTAMFNNVTMDAGSFFQTLIDPLLQKIQSATDPFMPVFRVLTDPLPVISDLAGSNITLLDLAKAFSKNGGPDTEVISDLINLINLIKSVPTSASGVFNFGSFELTGPSLRSDPDASGDTPDPLGGTTPTGTDPFADFLSNLQQDGIQLPILDNVSNVYDLFLGKKTNLVAYTLPDLHLAFTGHQFFPIFGPLGVGLDETFTATTHLSVGFDTQGFVEYQQDHKASDIIDGFYLTDHAGSDGSGAVIPVLQLYGGIGAGPELNAVVFDAGVTANIGAKVDFDLEGEDAEGKLRLKGLTDLSSLICTMGSFVASLTAFVKIGFDTPLGFAGYEKDFDFGSVTLLDFGSDCSGKSAVTSSPILGEVDPTTGILTLNMGPNAGLRKTFNTDDGDETFTVTHVSGSPSDPGGEAVRVDFMGYSQTIPGVKSIYAEGGLGNNTINIGQTETTSSGTTQGVLAPVNLWGGFDPLDPRYQATTGTNSLTGGDGPAVLHGADGNDTLRAGSGNSQLYGGGGNDILVGGAGMDLLDGGDGDDHLTAGSGPTTLDGDAGNDVLQAGSKTDILDGGTGDDTLSSGTGDATMIGGAGNDTFVLIDPKVADHAAVQTITVSGGGQVGDTALVIGNGGEAGVFQPSATAQGSGTTTLHGSGMALNVTFDTLGSVALSDMVSLVDLAANKANTLTVTNLLPGESPQNAFAPNGQNPTGPGGSYTDAAKNLIPADQLAATSTLVTGTSGPLAAKVGLIPMSFHDIAAVTLDNSSNTDSNYGDAITVSNPGGAALLASNLQNFSVLTGAGNDTLTVDANSYLLPVAGGQFVFAPGTGTYLDGTAASNQRGLISVDRIVASGDGDFRLTDASPLAPDGSAPSTTLTIARPGSNNAASLGTIHVVGGLESTRIIGGASDDVIDARGFLGNTELDAGSGTATLFGGLGNNLLVGGGGDDIFFGGDSPYGVAGAGLINSGQPNAKSTSYPESDGPRNIMIGGSGGNVFHVGTGGATIVGGAGANAYDINNPATGLLAAPYAIDITGNGSANDVLNLSGGGASLSETLLLDGSAGGQLVQTSAGNTQTPTTAQTIVFRNLGRLVDATAASSLSVGSASAGGVLTVGPALDLTSGNVAVAINGLAATPVSVSNHGAVSIFGPNGTTLATTATLAATATTTSPALVTATVAPLSVTSPAATVAAASPLAAQPTAAVAAAPVSLILGSTVVAGPSSALKVLKHLAGAHHSQANGHSAKVAHANKPHVKPLKVATASSHKATASAHQHMSTKSASRSTSTAH